MNNGTDERVDAVVLGMNGMNCVKIGYGERELNFLVDTEGAIVSVIFETA